MSSAEAAFALVPKVQVRQAVCSAIIAPRYQQACKLHDAIWVHWQRPAGHASEDRVVLEQPCLVIAVDGRQREIDGVIGRSMSSSNQRHEQDTDESGTRYAVRW